MFTVEPPIDRTSVLDACHYMSRCTVAWGPGLGGLVWGAWFGGPGLRGLVWGA
jgi:hypothetical protein